MPSSASIRRLLVLWLALWAASVSLLSQTPRSIHPAQYVGPVIMTVSDMDRAVDFYTRVLTFQQTADFERSGADYEQLYNLSNVHLRVVDLKLGDESIELLQFAAVNSTPIQADARSNDLSFQHIAIIVSDMDAAYGVLRKNRVAQCRHIRKYFRHGTTRLPGSRRFTSTTRMGIR